MDVSREPRSPDAEVTDPVETVPDLVGERAPFLSIKNIDGNDHTVRLEESAPRVTVGRASSCDIWLVDDEVSRTHAEFQFVEGGWAIADDGLSRNGTYLNDDRIIGRRRLSHGDIVRVGRTLIVYNHADAGPGGTTVIAPRAGH